ncbi:MAG: transporter substrate-binding domain-containing protein [Clostridia bacterium]|nr:transporter substrate-binding domain-containing protein [Clostridia bacterium]
MKSFLKFSAIALALTLLVSIAAGCAGGKEPDVTTTAADESAAASAADSSSFGKVLVATNPEFEPYEYLDENDNIVGFDADLVNAIGEIIGADMEFVSMDFEAVIASVNSGATDIAASGLTITEDRKLSVNFSDPYYQVSQIVITLADNADFDGATKEEVDAQLKAGKTIGVCSGYTGEFYVTDPEEEGGLAVPESNVKSYKGISLALEDLRNGIIDAIVFDNTSAKAAISTPGNEGKFKLNETVLTTEDYAIAVSFEKTELLEAINSAIAQLKESGKLNEMLTANGIDVLE